MDGIQILPWIPIQKNFSGFFIARSITFSFFFVYA